MRSYERIRRAVPIALGLAMLAFGGTEAFAQVTGKVIGTVTDRDTGQPLVGAQVVVEGTNLGNVTNEDGYYFINNVPVGVQGITAQYLGYQTTTQEHRILAGQTMTVDFALSSEVVQAEGIVAVIEREPLVARDNTISKSRFTGEDARDLPTESLTEVIELGAGIYADALTGGFVVRGGRVTESATYVDGALVTDFTNQRTGGFNTVNVAAGELPPTNPAPPVGESGVEEVDVITGGFNAEFGNAQSGIINIVTREGGREYHGNARFTTDEISDAIEQSYGYNSLQTSIGGPIVPERLTFFGSLEAVGAEDFAPTAAGYNPTVGFTRIDTDGDGEFDDIQANSTGSTEEVLPGNRGDETRLQAKLTAFLPADAKLTGTYLFARDQLEIYSPITSTLQFLSSGIRSKSHDVILNYDQQIFQTSERNLNLQVRGHYRLSRDMNGPPKSAALASILQDQLSQCGAACEFDGDTFEEDVLGYRFGDIEFFFEDSIPGSVPNVPAASSRPPDPVFGVPNLWFTDGLVIDDKTEKNERRYALRVDLDSQLNRVHRAKAGVEWTWINLLSENGEFNASTFSDVYDVDPRVGAAYVQDRLDYGDLVIDLGLRWDHWNPNTTFPALPGLVACEISPFPTQCTEDAETVEAPTRNEFAPRLGVAHPITDATQVRLSYGKFYQLPELQNFYSSFLTNFPGNPNIQYGNPNLEFVETTAFEAGITHLLSENLVLDVVGYNRDRRGAVRLDVFQSGSIDPAIGERRVFTNGDNGNVKGFDITVSKRYSNYFSTDLAWSLQWARGTTSSPIDWATGGGFGRLFDPLQPGVLLPPPNQLQPEDFDRLHNINWQFQLRFPDDFQEGTTVGTVFQNFGAFVVYNAQSGTPFTRRATSSRSEPLEELGASRLPWIHSGDVRVSKGFDIGEAFDFDVFAVVQNFLNTTNVVNINDTTGRPDVGGFERDDVPNIPADFLAEESDREFPFVIAEEILPDFQDDFTKQDLNGDGTITFEESEAVLFEARRAFGVVGGTNANVFGDSAFNYGAPRQIRFGAEIRF